MTDRNVVLACALTGVLWSATAGLAQPAPVDVTRYGAALEQAQQIAEAGVEEPSPGRMRSVRDALGRPLRLELGGRVVALGPDPVLSELEGVNSADFRIAGDRLSLLTEELEAASRAPSLDPTALASALEDAYREVNPRPTLAQRLWRFAEDLLARVAEALAGAGDGLGIGAAVLLGLLSAAGIWALARRLLVVADEHAPVNRTDLRSPADWRREAEEALAAGDLERAIRAQYRLLLHQLARRGVIRDAPSLTPAEARHAAAGAPDAVGSAVGEATAVFERMAYGDVPPERGDVERMRTAVEAASP